jgi:hypothetical protein
MLLAQRKKRVSGKNFTMCVPFSLGGGASATFADAQGNADGSEGVDFVVTFQNYYATQCWSTDVLQDSEGPNARAFFDARKFEMDNTIEKLSVSLSHGIFRSGSGSIGRVSASQVAGNTDIVLANPADAINLYVGAKIESSTADGGGSLSATVNFIKSVNEDAGTFTVSATKGGAALTATASGLVANQYIFREGDYDIHIKGLAAWIPATVASNDNFFGVNRSVDRRRLAGNYVTKYAGMPVEEIIQKVLTDMTANSTARPDVAVVHPTVWATLNVAFGSKVQLVNPTGDLSWGYEAISIQGPRGIVKVLADADCPVGEMFILQLDTIDVLHVDSEPVKVLDNDGKIIRMLESADAMEARVKFRGQIACRAPGFNARVVIA